MGLVVKKNDQPHRIVDLQARAGKSCLLETHHTPSPFNLAQSVSSGTRKTVLDAWNGYQAVLLDEDSREPTTFITKFGRYRYSRTPQGEWEHLNSSFRRNCLRRYTDGEMCGRHPSLRQRQRGCVLAYIRLPHLMQT